MPGPSTNRTNTTEPSINAIIDSISLAQKSGEKERLEKAVQDGQTALLRVPPGSLRRTALVITLASMFAKLYDQTFSIANLEGAIEYGQQAIVLTPAGHPERAGTFNNLAVNLTRRYEKFTAKPEDLVQAIELYRKAIDLTPIGNSDRVDYLGNLGNCFRRRFEGEMRPEHLTQAMKHYQEALDLIPVGDPRQAEFYGSFAICLASRYDREGKPEDLTQAINYSQKRVDLTPVGSPHRATRLNNLGSYLCRRYGRNGELEDLIQAIKCCQEAVNLTLVSDPIRAVRLSNLGICLSDRYKREGRRDHLMQAIEYCREAVELITGNDNDRAGQFSNLSIVLGLRYEEEGEPKDLTQAIENSQYAVTLTPPSNPDRAGRLNNLSNNLSTRYEKEGKLEDLIRATEYSREVVNLTLPGNPDRAMYLNNLINRLKIRYKREGKLEDLIQMVELSRNAIDCVESPPSTRIHGCVKTVNLLVRLQRWQEARALLGRAIKILPSLISNLSSKFDQENMMTSISNLAAIACAVSLECGDNGVEAVKVLELSRGTINRLVTDARAEISTPSRLDLELAKQLNDVRFLTNAPSEVREDGGRTGLSREVSMSISCDLIADNRRDLGFEDFPNASSATNSFETSSNHVTVILNTTWFRTDALLIHDNKRIQLLPLEKSVFQQSKIYRNKLDHRFGLEEHGSWTRSNEGMREFLKWLWDKSVEPVLHAFGFAPSDILSNSILPDHQNNIPYRRGNRSRGLDPDALKAYMGLMKQQTNVTSSIRSAKPSETRFRATINRTATSFPRIHWIGTGYTGGFPFHAAGYGSQDTSKNTMSYAISSYASTLTGQAYAKQKPAAFEASSSNLLLVAMPKTPGQSNLPGVEEEAKIIHDTLHKITNVKLRKLPPVDVVLKDLPLYKSIHFACHAFADPKSPLRSGLLLCGDEPNKQFDMNTRNSTLTVETISSMNTQRSLLAFLSACCTAENASPILLDEGIHLASGFQLAGYPHVIASLWEANDALSVTVAEKFYRIVFAESDIAGHDRIAYALHDAVVAARRICEDPLSWATTIHFGP